MNLHLSHLLLVILAKVLLILFIVSKNQLFSMILCIFLVSISSIYAQICIISFIPLVLVLDYSCLKCMITLFVISLFFTNSDLYLLVNFVLKSALPGIRIVISSCFLDPLFGRSFSTLSPCSTFPLFVNEMHFL